MSLQELAVLTKNFLLEEYSSQNFIWTDRATYEYFRSLAIPSPQEQQPAPLPPLPAYKPQQPVAPAKKAIATPTVEKIKDTPPKRQTESTEETTGHDFSAVRAALHEAASHLKIIDTIPDDSIAKRVANSWKEILPEVILISDDATAEQSELLQKISNAIISLGYTSALMANDIVWELLLTAPHLKMILMTQQSLQKYPELQQKYRYDQSRKRHYIDGILLCPLPSLEKLESDPGIKANLWQTIRLLLK